jgi:REP element-mobilizing transposase RayT
MLVETKFYRRNLPHFHPQRGCFFITSRLADSISKEKIRELELLKARLTNAERLSQKELKIIKSHHFKRFDSSLDDALNGPLWLKKDNIAQIVADSLKFYDSTEYDLYCYSIMSNHVHSVLQLLENSLPLSTILQRHKGFTARECNKILSRTGSFWHHESYDHVISTPEEFERIIQYTLDNPVKAGLVSDWKKWKWNYLKPGLLF